MMPILLLIQITLLFAATLLALQLTKRSTAALRHLICLSAFAGSLLLPLAALLPARAIAIRLPAIQIATASFTAAAAGAKTWSWSGIVFSLWAFGSTLLLLRLALGYGRIRHLVRAGTLVEPAVYLADVGVPIVSGLFRPAILMPRRSSEWPAWQFDAAVRHELTHVRRNDLWSNFIAQIATAVYWFHPLVWLLSRDLQIDQEEACDNAVLVSGFDPATYAQALLAVARTSTSTLLPGCPMTTQINLKTRIARLLDISLARTTSRANLLRTGIAFAVVLSAIGMLGPQKGIAQSAPSPGQSGEIFKVGGEVTSPRVIYKEDPAYTEEARQAKINGSVMLSVVVGADGMARDVNIVKGLDPGLDRNAAEILLHWRFAPATRNGEPVAVRATIEINFRLQ
jgi:TonB family protein